jgi:L-asparagine oxygenase
LSAPSPPGPPCLALDAGERRQLGELADELAATYTCSDDPGLLERLPLQARALPERLVEFLTALRLHEDPPACVVHLLDIDDSRIGPSPTKRRATPDRGPTRREEMALVLAASLLGDVFSWSTLQGGRIVQDLAPLAAEAHEKSGYGSQTPLEPHTEDAFHPYRCDYLALLCLRNPDAVPTTWAPIDAARITPDQRRVLFESRFRVLPDPEHLRHFGPGPHPWDTPVGILSGDPRAPYVRVDAFFTEIDPADDEAADALAQLSAELERELAPAVLKPGELFVIDNYRAVHGRGTFHARYDGTDRWLKRISVTRDLRRSRKHRSSPSSRVIR